MRPSLIILLALAALASPAAGAGTRIERLAEQKLMAELGCLRAPRPVPLVRWLLRNGLVRSVGPGADGVAALIPTRPLTLLGRRILYLEAWGVEDNGSGRLVAPWPFEMNVGMHMQFVAVMLRGVREDVEPLVRRRLARAQVPDNRNGRFMQVTEVVCTQFSATD